MDDSIFFGGFCAVSPINRYYVPAQWGEAYPTSYCVPSLAVSTRCYGKMA